MKTLTLFEIFIVLYAYIESLPLGFLVMIFVFIAESNLKEEKQKSRQTVDQLKKTLGEQYQDTKRKLLAMVEAEKIEREAEQDFTPPVEMPKFVVNYGKYMIEDYGGWYIVLYPNMKPYPKLFNNIEHAKKIIDDLSTKYANT